MTIAIFLSAIIPLCLMTDLRYFFLFFSLSLFFFLFFPFFLKLFLKKKRYPNYVLLVAYSCFIVDSILLGLPTLEGFHFFFNLIII